MNHRCFGCWALSLLLLVALVTTTHLEQGLIVKVVPDHEPHHPLQQQEHPIQYIYHFDVPTACAIDNSPMQLRPYSMPVLPIKSKAIPVAPTANSAVAVMDRRRRRREPFAPSQRPQSQPQDQLALPVLSYTDSTSLGDLLKPALLEVAALVVFQVIGIPILSKVFAICCSNYGGVGAMIVSRVPWLKNAGRLKHIWKVTYHTSRPPLRMLRKAQKFIKNWYGPEAQHRKRSKEISFPLAM